MKIINKNIYPSKYIYRAIIILLLLLSPESAYSRMTLSGYPTPEEMKVLPRWAQVVLLTGPRTNPPAHLLKERSELKKKYGEMFIDASHHFAAALNWINRYNRSFSYSYDGVESDRQQALRKAFEEFQFMRGRMKSTHVLYPVLLINEALVYRAQGNYTFAQKNYDELIKLKPKYPMGYILYSDFMKSIGEEEIAKGVLQLGYDRTEGSEVIRKAMDTDK